MNESSTDSVNYEGQSAYDVADMLKQFFRDLPEPLMTNKLSETSYRYTNVSGEISAASGRLCSKGGTL